MVSRRDYSNCCAHGSCSSSTVCSWHPLRCFQLLLICCKCLCFVLCVLCFMFSVCFVFCVLCFVFCVLCFVFVFCLYCWYFVKNFIWQGFQLNSEILEQDDGRNNYYWIDRMPLDGTDAQLCACIEYLCC